MVKMEVIFGARPVMTPDFAAELAHQASRFASEVSIEDGSTKLCVDSLIGLLAMNLRKGMRVTLYADGTDEQDALAQTARLLQGEEGADQ